VTRPGHAGDLLGDSCSDCHRNGDKLGTVTSLEGGPREVPRPADAVSGRAS
jgi:hypothetical protein